jgi:putative tricarboxylic transport membrane protein
MLLILNLPLIGIWVKLLKVPYHYLSVLIMLFCVIGSYGIGYSADDIIIMTLFGLIGYLAKKTGFELTPMVFGLVLGPMLENALRRSLVISNGSFGIFFTRPLSSVFLVISILFLMWTLLFKRRPAISGEEG